ncbi:helix-turn-helix DNA binding domain protein [Gordonia phage Trine]|uniref:DNA binding protein n=1 Tax=Gordonia phage Trine TaxID=2201431 RepID=A0A2Z4QAM2_9CAUD|nr:helix-turn-helix DNA binding domain protein [Gordonia phage Trine]AWY06558.1 DNA binding protein [Gordonia phage Trine]
MTDDVLDRLPPGPRASLEVRRAKAADRREDAAILRRRGLTVAQIAERLGVTQRTITRDLAAAGVQIPRRY